MNWTQDEIRALETAIKSGVTEVTYNGRTTKYRSLKEMKDILRDAAISVSSSRAGSRLYMPKTTQGYQ